MRELGSPVHRRFIGFSHAYPTVVCLCGSTRFGEAFREANLRETLAGRIVLSIGCEWHSDQALGLTDADNERLDELYLRKIDLADEVLILNVGGYILGCRVAVYLAARIPQEAWGRLLVETVVPSDLDARVDG